MNLALTVITMLFAEQQFQFHAMLESIIKWLIRGFLFLVRCILGPMKLFNVLKLRERCPPLRNKLLLISASELGKKIREQEITSEEVVMAYITRCKEINPIINAIVETRFEVAIQEAQEADDLIRSGEKDIHQIARETPLLGIPITVKGSIAVQGMSHEAGRKWGKQRLALQDADVIQKIRAAGGIVILVSNTPEMCMFWETDNNVIGKTVNPYDTRKTPGGSSGGEAALLGSAASVLGISSDIGGSARLPAMFCGLFGHKPTPGSVSTNGHMPDSDEKIWPNFFTIAAMVRYAEDLPLLLKTMMNEADVKKCNLEKEVSMNEIKFFFMEDDGGSILTSSPDRDIEEGIRRVVNHLKSRYVVKKTEIEDMKYSTEIAVSLLLGIEVETIFMKGTDPREWKSVFVEIMKYIFMMSPHTFPTLFHGILKKLQNSLPESYLKKMGEKNASLKEKFAELLGDNGVLIYPTFPFAADYPYQTCHKLSNVSYMTIFNTLGLPVTQCPIGFNSNGLPIGIQIVANPGCDNLTIRVAQELEKEFGGWQPPMSSEKLARNSLINT